MNFSGIALVHAPQNVVWDLLLDPETLRGCLPGCQAFEQAGEDTFEVTLTLGIGAVKGNYKGNVRLGDREPPNRYTLIVQGTGSSGSVRGTGTVELSAAPDGTTLRWTADAQIAGLIASVGQRLLGGVARQKADEFFGCLERRASAAGQPTASASQGA